MEKTIKSVFGQEAGIIITDLENKNFSLPEGVKLAMPCQTHTNAVEIVRCADNVFPDTDGLISFDKSIAVGIRTADCQPVLIYASDIEAVAAIHAGWRGTLRHIARNAVLKLIDNGASAENIIALLGPSVCGDCYEVSEDLVNDFRREGFTRIHSKNHLDLKQLNAEDLEAAGVKRENISIMPDCTLHTRNAGDSGFLYPSWRRNPGTIERLISAIWMK